MMMTAKVLWECPAYSSLRSNFLQGKLGMMGLSICVAKDRTKQ